MSLDDFMETFKKLEKFLTNDLSKHQESLSWYFETARDAMIKMYRDAVKVDLPKESEDDREFIELEK